MEEYYYSYEEYGGDMSLDMSVLKCRLRDAFGGDSQETIMEWVSSLGINK